MSYVIIETSSAGSYVHSRIYEDRDDARAARDNWDRSVKAEPTEFTVAALHPIDFSGHLAMDLNVATMLASVAHNGQVDKAGQPYIDHVRAVAEALEPHGQLAVAAGWLHDVVEDTDYTLDDLRRLDMPAAVVSAVDSVTRREGEPYMDMIRRAAADPLGRLVKLADNAHNSSEERMAALDLIHPEMAPALRKRYAKAREILLTADQEASR